VPAVPWKRIIITAGSAAAAGLVTYGITRNAKASAVASVAAVAVVYMLSR
jgi:hypothetical protein